MCNSVYYQLSIDNCIEIFGLSDYKQLDNRNTFLDLEGVIHEIYDRHLTGYLNRYSNLNTAKVLSINSLISDLSYNKRKWKNYEDDLAVSYFLTYIQEQIMKCERKLKTWQINKEEV